MKKSIYIGIFIVLASFLVGVSVSANNNQSEKIVDNIGRSGSVYTFRHNGNRCYVIESRGMKDSHSISCVRFE